MVRLPFATCLVPNHPLWRSSFTRVETYHWDFCINFAMRRWPTLTMLLFFGLNPPITTNTLKALSLTLGSNATCIAAIDHHPGEKAIGSMPLSVCWNTDSALALSRSGTLITESSNGTFYPRRRDVKGTAPLQDFAGFAQDKVAWTRLGRAGHACQAVGAQRTCLSAAVAQRFARLDFHTHAMAAIACLPLAVFVDQEHWPTISSVRTPVAHSVSSGATVSRSAGTVRFRSKPPCLIT